MPVDGWSRGPIDIGGSRGVRLPPFPRPGGSVLRWVLAAAALLVLLLTGYYQVEPDEVAVVQRFGRFVRTSDPGPHLKLPFGVETVTKVPVERTLKMEFGFRTVTPGHQVHVRGTVGRDRGRVRDAHRRPQRGGRRVDRAVPDQGSQASTSSTCATCPRPSATCRRPRCARWSGDHSVDEVLTIGREAIALQAKEELQRLCDRYGIGIEVQQLVLQDVNPPDPVRPAFNEVNQAIQEKERAINDAWADYNKAVPAGQGRGRAGGARGRGLCPRAREQGRGRRQALRRRLRGVQEGPRGDAQAHLPRDDGAACCRSSGGSCMLDEKAKGILPLLQLDGERKEVKP